MWLLQFLAWIGSELFIARAAAENKAEALSILHGDAQAKEQQPRELWPFKRNSADGRRPTADSR